MKVVVKQQRPLRALLLSALGVATLGAASVHFLHAEREGYDAQVAELRRDRQRLARQNRKLLADNELLRRRVAAVERSTEIDAKAYEQVNEHLRSLQEELQLVKEEVSFYQGIMSDGKRRGVRIQRFLLEADDDGRQHHFRLVLTRSSEDDRVLAGTVSMTVDGERAGKQARLSFNQVEAEKRDVLEFRFRHFQRIEGKLDVPQDFKPSAVEVVVRTVDKDKTVSMRETFAWPLGRS